MCKLQIIEKKDAIIISDRLFDVPILRRININNIPYFLTIDYSSNGDINYFFTFTDSEDKRPFNWSDTMIYYGNTTGRVYSIAFRSKADHISNRIWENIKKEIENIPEISLPIQTELKNFIDCLQSLSHILVKNKMSSDSN